MKQTAVEWLFEQYVNKSIITLEDIEQAKEMEKNQIINAYLKRRKRTDLLGALKIMDDAEQYYKENFKSE